MAKNAPEEKEKVSCGSLQVFAKQTGKDTSNETSSSLGWNHQSCKYKSRIRQCINVNVNINVDGFTCKGSWYVASSVEHPILSLITFIVRNIHNI